MPGSYNLSLGTIWDGVIDYTETTDNGDRNKVLATIVHIAKIYSTNYPHQKIFIRGRNQITTRLYRGVINHEYQETLKEFIIQGGTYIENENTYDFEEFIAKKQYDAFLFEKRQGTF